jgi:hypothetical protein
MNVRYTGSWGGGGAGLTPDADPRFERGQLTADLKNTMRYDSSQLSRLCLDDLDRCQVAFIGIVAQVNANVDFTQECCVSGHWRPSCGKRSACGHTRRGKNCHQWAADHRPQS